MKKLQTRLANLNMNNKFKINLRHALMKWKNQSLSSHLTSLSLPSSNRKNKFIKNKSVKDNPSQRWWKANPKKRNFPLSLIQQTKMFSLNLPQSKKRNVLLIFFKVQNPSIGIKFPTSNSQRNIRSYNNRSIKRRKSFLDKNKKAKIKRNPLIV